MLEGVSKQRGRIVQERGWKSWGRSYSLKRGTESKGKEELNLQGGIPTGAFGGSVKGEKTVLHSRIPKKKEEKRVHLRREWKREKEETTLANIRWELSCFLSGGRTRKKSYLERPRAL